MTALVVAEHDNTRIKDSTFNTITAALEIADENIDLLCAGNQCGSVASDAAKIPGVRKVLIVDSQTYDKKILMAIYNNLDVNN